MITDLLCLCSWMHHYWQIKRKGFLKCGILCHIPIKNHKILSLTKHINDGIHSQCIGIHKDHGPWVPGTHKQVNDFESLHLYVEFIHGDILGKLCMKDTIVDILEKIDNAMMAPHCVKLDYNLSYHIARQMIDLMSTCSKIPLLLPFISTQ